MKFLNGRALLVNIVVVWPVGCFDEIYFLKSSKLGIDVDFKDCMFLPFMMMYSVQGEARKRKNTIWYILLTTYR